MTNHDHDDSPVGEEQQTGTTAPVVPPPPVYAPPTSLPQPRRTSTGRVWTAVVVVVGALLILLRLAALRPAGYLDGQPVSRAEMSQAADEMQAAFKDAIPGDTDSVMKNYQPKTRIGLRLKSLMQEADANEREVAAILDKDSFDKIINDPILFTAEGRKKALKRLDKLEGQMDRYFDRCGQYISGVVKICQDLGSAKMDNTQFEPLIGDLRGAVRTMGASCRGYIKFLDKSLSGSDEEIDKKLEDKAFVKESDRYVDDFNAGVKKLSEANDALEKYRTENISKNLKILQSK